MRTAIVLTAALLVLDRVLKLLAYRDKLHFSGKILRLTHLENPGFFLGAGSRYRFILRWVPLLVCGGHPAAAPCGAAAESGAAGYSAGAHRRAEQPVRPDAPGERNGLCAAAPRREKAGTSGVERGGLHAAGRRGADSHRCHPGNAKKVTDRGPRRWRGPLRRQTVTSPCSTGGSGSSPRSRGLRSAP